jgi:uncharacterized protein YbdZ (MbtH family)
MINSFRLHSWWEVPRAVPEGWRDFVVILLVSAVDDWFYVNIPWGEVAPKDLAMSVMKTIGAAAPRRPDRAPRATFASGEVRR